MWCKSDEMSKFALWTSRGQVSLTSSFAHVELNTCDNIVKCASPRDHLICPMEVCNENELGSLKTSELVPIGDDTLTDQKL